MATPRPIRLALVADYPEEGWPSMDLTAEMIRAYLERDHSDRVVVTPVVPPYRYRLRGASRNVDRLLNRFWDYPRALARHARRGAFDLYHLADHSYSQLVHALPPGRAVVTCHDLDTFRCVLEPEREPRPRWFRAMAGRILGGLSKAAALACVSEATRDAVLAHGIVPADRAWTIPNGISPEFGDQPDPSHDAEATRLLGPLDPGGPPDLLHVGSTIPRKRIDILLNVFSSIRRTIPGARLIKVGSPLTAEQARQAEALGVAEALVPLPFLDRATVAAVYRRAALVLQPSEAEGFGLPVAEAQACGAVVLASDITALREVGGPAAVYRPVADVDAWTAAALALLDERRADPQAWLSRRHAGLDRASLFRWTTHAARLMEVYDTVLGRASTG